MRGPEVGRVLVRVVVQASAPPPCMPRQNGDPPAGCPPQKGELPADLPVPLHGVDPAPRGLASRGPLSSPGDRRAAGPGWPVPARAVAVMAARSSLDASRSDVPIAVSLNCAASCWRSWRLRAAAASAVARFGRFLRRLARGGGRQRRPGDGLGEAFWLAAGACLGDPGGRRAHSRRVAVALADGCTPGWRPGCADRRINAAWRSRPAARSASWGSVATGSRPFVQALRGRVPGDGAGRVCAAPE